MSIYNNVCKRDGKNYIPVSFVAGSLGLTRIIDGVYEYEWYRLWKKLELVGVYGVSKNDKLSGELCRVLAENEKDKQVCCVFVSFLDALDRYPPCFEVHCPHDSGKLIDLPSEEDRWLPLRAVAKGLHTSKSKLFRLLVAEEELYLNSCDRLCGRSKDRFRVVENQVRVSVKGVEYIRQHIRRC